MAVRPRGLLQAAGGAGPGGRRAQAGPVTGDPVAQAGGARYCPRCGARLTARGLAGRRRPVCPRCGYAHYEQLKVGAAALVERDGRLLLLERTQEPFAGHWNLPAGYVEVDESPAQAAVREGYEETGLRLEAVAVEDVCFFDDDPRGNGILIVYRCRVVGGELGAGQEAARAAYFAPGDVPERLAGGGHNQAIRGWQRSTTTCRGPGWPSGGRASVRSTPPAPPSARAGATPTPSGASSWPAITTCCGGTGMPELPEVCLISLGGTICMAGRNALGAVPTLSPEELVAALPELAALARVQTVPLRLLPGPHVTIDDLVALAAEARRRLAAGAAGIVVTQGTDTIEEVAFGLDLLVPGPAPVVVTGALRNPSLPGADGPANLLSAVQVAASQDARGLGALVVLNEEIHSARFVQKTHTANPGAFRSRLVGPVGWVAEGRVRIALRLAGRQHLAVPEGAADCPVALVTLAMGDDGRLLSAIEPLGFRGLVVEALGGGHVPVALIEPLTRLAAAMPVVLASRTGCGEVLRCTYGFPGSESDLLARGLIPAGALDGPKARLLLALLLRSGASRAQVAHSFETWLVGPHTSLDG